MATVTITRGKTLPDSGNKNDLHELVDLATGGVSDIVNADVKSNAAIEGTKIAPNFGTQDVVCGDITMSGDFNLIPTGIITMWHGSIASIPSGWVLCDGSNSTPDLTNRFIVGADADDSGTAKSTVTGSALQTSDGQIPAHTHTVNRATGGATPACAGANGGDLPTINTGSYGTGTKTIATFYALAYIMKT